MSPQNVALRRARSMGVVFLSCVLLCSSSLSDESTTQDTAAVAAGGSPASGVAGTPSGLLADAAGGAPDSPVDGTATLAPDASTDPPAVIGVATVVPSATAPPVPGGAAAVGATEEQATTVPGPAAVTDPAVTDPAVPDEAGAVWCQALPVTFPTARADGSVPVGAATVSGAAGLTAAGRTVAWSVTSSGRVVASGTTLVGTGGAFSAPVVLPAGPASVSTALRFPGSTTEACPPSLTSFDVSSAVTWASGASGAGAADGTFATWRGTPTPVAGTWADNNEAMLGLWQLRPGFEFADWRGDLDIAVGAIGPGETWAAAAAGAYDARWRQSLTELSRLWAGRPGQLYIRFAHEFNGNWYPWSVTASTVADFRTAWIRYRALQRALFPDADLVFSPNSETHYWSDLDWRTAFPGAQYVDVMAVDYYNMWPFTGTPAEFTATSLSYDRWGAPRGLQRHREFAASVGLPFAVPEWGNNAEFGDSPAYIEQMNAFFRAHAGQGPGQLRYEVYFNVVWDGNPFALFPSTNAPGAADAYRRVF